MAIRRPQSLPLDEMPPELHRLCRRRDRTSDSIMLFAAMAVEAFVNFYGVFRLGEEQFKRHVERLPLERKTQLLLLICDGLEVDNGDRLIIAIKAVAERRNTLAHPKARKVPRDQPAKDRTGWPIPETAQEQIQAMREFFSEFGRLVPGVAFSSPSRSRRLVIRRELQLVLADRSPPPGDGAATGCPAPGGRGGRPRTRGPGLQTAASQRGPFASASRASAHTARIASATRPARCIGTRRPAAVGEKAEIREVRRRPPIEPDVDHGQLRLRGSDERLDPELHVGAERDALDRGNRHPSAR